MLKFHPEFDIIVEVLYGFFSFKQSLIEDLEDIDILANSIEEKQRKSREYEIILGLKWLQYLHQIIRKLSNFLYVRS